MKAKLCRKCNKIKSLSDFSRDKSHSDGHFSLCKKCKSAYKKKHKARDPKSYLAMAAGCRKRYETRHPERVKAQKILNNEAAKRRYAQDPKVIKARQEKKAREKNRALHPEKYKALEREKSRTYLAVNRERINVERRARYANDPVFKAKEKERDKKRRPQRRVAYRKRRDRDPEKYQAKQKAYANKSRVKRNAQIRKRRARDPGKFRVWGRKAYYKRKGIKIGYELMIAANIVQSTLTKGVEDKN